MATIWIGKNDGTTILAIKNPSLEQLILYLSLVHQKTVIRMGSVEENNDKEYWVERIELGIKEDWLAIVVIEP